MINLISEGIDINYKDSKYNRNALHNPSPDEWQFDHVIPKDKGGTLYNK